MYAGGSSARSVIENFLISFPEILFTDAHERKPRNEKSVHILYDAFLFSPFSIAIPQMEKPLWQLAEKISLAINFNLLVIIFAC